MHGMTRLRNAQQTKTKAAQKLLIPPCATSGYRAACSSLWLNQAPFLTAVPHKHNLFSPWRTMCCAVLLMCCGFALLECRCLASLVLDSDSIAAWNRWSLTSKPLHTWKMPSTARMCDRKALPRPSPDAAPLFQLAAHRLMSPYVKIGHEHLAIALLYKCTCA